MTGNRNGHWIRGTSARHGETCFRMADVRRDLAVRFRRATRNRLQRLPNAPLERGSLNVQRKRDLVFATDNRAESFHLVAEPAILANDFRLRILAAQLSFQRRDRLSETDG